jgi:hypothetical protein
MSGAYDTHGGKNAYRILVENLKEIDRVEETRTDGITILKWVLQEKNGTRRTRFA